jgi:predicted metal-binding membrane protein
MWNGSTRPDVETSRTVTLGPAFAAMRARLALIGLLLALAALGWWWTADRMRGMDEGPGTPPGALAWFVGVWVVMMAAMMLPSVSPTVALYARMTRSRAPWAPLAFTAGYLLSWSAAGVLAYGVFVLGRELAGDALAWDGAGRWLAGGTLLLAAAYELTPVKNVSLAQCRSPLGFLMDHRRTGLAGAVRMGARHGTWCLGCCWALMASLFALGVMSIAAMAFVAAVIAFEKTVPWERPARWATAGALVVLGVLLIAAPEAIPGLTIPGDGMEMQPNGMEMMP